MPASLKISRQPSSDEHPGHAVVTAQQLQLQQPLNGLPSNNNVTLAYSTLGIGLQNYTCNGTAYVQTESGDGASALLYDTTEFLERHPNQINDLAQHCNYEQCDYPHLLNRLLGDHYFSVAHTPTFNLTYADTDLVLSAAKVGDEPAPASQDIDWLLLTANTTDGITQGLAEVYRIDTYRGKAPSACDKAGQAVQVPYTAQYWFFQ